MAWLYLLYFTNMSFNLIQGSIFFIIFILAVLVIWVCINIFRFLKKGKGEYPFQRYFSENEFFLRISENFKKQLEELIEKEVQKNIEEFKNTFQKTSDEIIQNYRNQFISENQEVQKILSKFSQQILKEISTLSSFILETQNKISEEAKNKILELNLTAKKEFIKIQEINLKTSSQISYSIRETLNKKVQETEKEIENYKKERFKEIDREIYHLLGEVAKKTVGKAIDLSTHEKLVLEVLEKAKKEIF